MRIDLDFKKDKRLASLKNNALCKAFILATVFGFAALGLTPEPASAKLVKDTDFQLKSLPHSHLNLWMDDEKESRGVVIAMHGLIMHGGVFDTLAKELAENGFTVIAADMRGYGRWAPSQVEKVISRKNSSVSDLGVRVSVFDKQADLDNIDLDDQVVEDEEFLKDRSKVLYSESFKDLLKLTRAVKSEYGEKPVFLVGESMGAGMAIHVAGEAPDCVDGLVLSSPAIKKKLNLVPRLVLDMARLFRHPKSPLNLKPYILKFASEDPIIARSCAEDPMVRKELTAKELLKTSREIGRNIKYVEKVPADIPVLVIQGDKDRMVKSNGVVSLLERLKSKDQTVKWFPGKGHLLIETPYITDETLDVVKGWLDQHADQEEVTDFSASSR